MEFPRNVALTLARPLLWAAFEPSLLGFLPGKLTQRIQMAYALVRNLPPGTNPVGKRLIVVNGARQNSTLTRSGIQISFRTMWVKKSLKCQQE